MLLVLHCMDGLGGWVCFVCEQCISLVRIDCIEPAKLDGRFGGGYGLVIRMGEKVRVVLIDFGWLCVGWLLCDLMLALMFSPQGTHVLLICYTAFLNGVGLMLARA